MDNGVFVLTTDPLTLALTKNIALPNIGICLDALNGASWFSTLDLRADYHNVPIALQDRDKTAFLTRRGSWRYKTMPFGVTCGPAVMQHLMDLVLTGLTLENMPGLSG